MESKIETGSYPRIPHSRWSLMAYFEAESSLGFASMLVLNVMQLHLLVEEEVSVMITLTAAFLAKIL